MPEQDLVISDRLAKAFQGCEETQNPEDLESLILKDGKVHDSIKFWVDPEGLKVVVDGMRRWPILQKHGLPYTTQEVAAGDTYDDAEDWMWEHQGTRRNLTREGIGKWYLRRKKRSKCTGNKELQPGVTNVTPAPSNKGEDAAEDIAKKTGVNRRTVIRAGQRVETLAKCQPSIQKGVESGAFKLSDTEVKTLSKLDPADQQAIATDLRKGQATSVLESMGKRGIKAPSSKRKGAKKPPKEGATKKTFDKSIFKTSIGVVTRNADTYARFLGLISTKEGKTVKHTSQNGYQSYANILKKLDEITELVNAWVKSCGTTKPAATQKS